MSTDPFGKACLDYLSGKRGHIIEVESLECETHEMPVDYLFRSYSEMPDIEKTALNLVKGKVLDIGAGAGPHAKHLKQKGHSVTCIEISDGAVECLNKQGLNVVQEDIFKFYPTENFDTILLLMNGTGIAKNENEFQKLILHLSSLLTPTGKILIESTDLIYLFEDDPDFIANANEHYYGIVNYRMHYKNHHSNWFSWLYLDQEKLIELVKKCNLKPKVVFEGKMFNFLVEIKKT